MRRSRVWVIAAVGVLLLTGVALAGAAGSYEIPWDAYTSGGEQMSSDHYMMKSTAGQELVGDTSSDGYLLEAGYWIVLEEGQPTIYLPMVLRDYN